MSASHRYSPERIVTVTVRSMDDVWTNETGERVYVDKLELELDDEVVVIVDVGTFLEPDETVGPVKLKLS